MGWLKLDDEFPDHPKIDPLSDGGHRLHVNGLCYAARHLTDGFVPAARVPRLVPRYKPAQLTELLAGGLWHPDVERDGFVIHDFLDWNPTSADAKERRRVRAEAGRMGGKRSGEVRRTKGEANGQANGQASASGVGRTPSRPVPSSRGHVGGEDPLPPASDAGEEDLIVQAARVIAERRLALRSPAKEPLVDRDRYLETVTFERARHHHATAHELLDDELLTPAELADLLEPELAPSAAAGFDRDCELCQGSTFVLVEDGAAPCSRCRP